MSLCYVLLCMTRINTFQSQLQGPPGAVAVVSLASLAQPDPIQPNITSMTSMAPSVLPTMQTISAIQPICSLAAAVPTAITVQARSM